MNAQEHLGEPWCRLAHRLTVAPSRALSPAPSSTDAQKEESLDPEAYPTCWSAFKWFPAPDNGSQDCRRRTAFASFACFLDVKVFEKH